ncbi:MAG: rane protein [Pseudomonas sp.]|nr:rane protein [Pseudomonas sp.]
MPDNELSTGHVSAFVRECWLLPILMLATLVRFYDVTQPSIWYDEGFSVLVSAYSPALIWFHSSQDVHPPLYYLLLHGWTAVFGNGVFAVRAMSLLAGVLAVGLGEWLVRLIATRRAAIIAGLLLALLPIAVRYSQEARMYALMGVWLLGATLTLMYWVKQPQRYRYLVLYTVLMTAAFYTHYFAAVCVLSHWVYLLVLRLMEKQQRLITRPVWWIANAAIVVFYLPWIPELLGQMTHTKDVDWIPGPSLYTLPSVIWQYLTLNDGKTLPWPLYSVMPLLLVLIIGGVALRDSGPYRFNALLASYTLVPLLAIFLVSFELPLFSARYFVFAAMGVPMLLAIALDRLAQRNRGLALACLIVLIGMQSVGLYNVYTQNNHLNDPIHDLNNHVGEMTAYINEHFEPGDRILVHGNYWYLSVVYYNASGTRPLLYTPPSVTGISSRPRSTGAGTLFYQNANTTYVDHLDDLPVGTQRVWLAYGLDAVGSVPMPDQWTLLMVRNFGDTQLRLYTLHPQTH